MKRGGWLLLGLVLAVLTRPLPASAHSMQVALVQIVRTGPEQLTLTLKTPELQGKLPALSLQLHERCEREALGRPERVESGLVEHWRIRCVGGLAERPFTLRGLGPGVAEALVSWDTNGASAGSRVLELEQPSAPLWPGPQAAGPESSAGTGLAQTSGYLELGVEHILNGADHLVFVLGLVLVCSLAARHGEPVSAAASRSSLARVAGAVTAFSVAHSITLALSVIGYLGLPSASVELLIALSILLLAVELARHGDTADTLTFRRPWLVAFGFGLLHGCGFAGALAEVGLPRDAVWAALLLFNLGVELGQLLFVTFVLGAAQIARRLGRPEAQRSARWVRVASYAIGGLAAFWCFERAATIWPPGL